MLAVIGLDAIRDGARVAPSRTAAIGGTFVALRAGEIVASIVIPTPIKSDTTTVRVCNTVPFVGRSTPTALKNAFSPFASRKPQNSPMIAATRPVMKPSSNTERLTCLREAPSVRRVASSRTRWETVIESVLKMTNEPTISEIAAKASRKYLMIASESPVSLESAAPCSAPVRTTAELSSSGRTWSATAASLVPLFAAMKIESTSPCLFSMSCAVGTSKTANVAPPIESTEPYLAMPTMLNSRVGPSAEARILSPTL